jgi:hypothetical protein
MTEVASLRGHWKPFAFAKKLAAFAKIFTRGYNYPMIVVERNNHGHAVLLQLLEHEKTPNVYKTEDGKPGWLTNLATRPIMLDQYIEAVEQRAVKINSKVTLQETLTLVSNRGKIEAADGMHDDMVMATAIAVQMLLKHAGRIKVYSDINNAILV